MPAIHAAQGTRIVDRRQRQQGRQKTDKPLLQRKDLRTLREDGPASLGEQADSLGDVGRCRSFASMLAVHQVLEGMTEHLQSSPLNS